MRKFLVTMSSSKDELKNSVTIKVHANNSHLAVCKALEFFSSKYVYEISELTEYTNPHPGSPESCRQTNLFFHHIQGGSLNG